MAARRQLNPDDQPQRRHGRAGKTIAVVSSYAESLINFRAPLLRAMVERGHRVTACAPAASDAIVEALRAEGVAYRDVRIDRGGMRPDRDIRTLFSLVALFRELRPDVVFNYMIKPVIYGSLAARMAGVPARFSMITGLGSAFGSEGGPPPPLWRAVQLMYRQSLRKNRCVFFQNPDDRRLFERLGIVRGREQIVVLNGSGVDLEHFRPAPLPQGPSFLLIARLIGDKGVREYVQAARIIRARHPETAFRLAGWIDAQHAGAITERELRAWSDQGVVEFLGQLPDIRAAIAESAVYVLPSYYREGTPRTVLEAMAMGRAIVTTDAPGCRETVQEGVNGYLVPVRDAGALARALERFIKEPALIQAMGCESRRIAIEKYDVHQVNARILEAMELI